MPRTTGRGRGSARLSSTRLESDVKSKAFVSPYWTLEEDPGDRVVALRRTSTPFASVDEIGSANRDIVARIRAEHRRWGVVVDMRRAPRRNDPAFEAAMRGLREAVEASFARTAVLLQTAVGVLQVTRLTREDGTGTFATQDEPAAFRFARGESLEPSEG
jgi:hypothetical protein